MNNKLYQVSWLIIVFVLLANLGIYFTHGIPMSHLADEAMRNSLFNSDSLELPALYKNIVLENGSFMQWYWTPTPYYFPDMPLYYFSEKITGNYYYAIALYFTIEALFLIWIIFLLYKEFFSSRMTLILTAMTFSAIYVFPAPTYILQFMSTFHYSEFLVSLVTLYLVLRFLKSKEIQYILLFSLFILSILMVISDRLFVLHFLLPLIAASVFWVLMYPRNWKKGIFLIVFSITVILLGEGVRPLLIPHPIIYPNISHPRLEWSMLETNLPLLKNIWKDAWIHYRMNFFILVITLTVFVGYVVKNIFIKFSKKITIEQKNITLFIATFILSMTVGTLTAMALTTNEVTERHMIAIFILPIIFLPIYIIFMTPLKIRMIAHKYMWVFVLIAFVLVLLKTRHHLIHKQFHPDYTSSLSRCVDAFISQTGAKYGVSQYWQSKKIYMLSKYDITLAQVHRDLRSYKWVTTLDWYREKYDFALIDHHAIQNYYKLNDYEIMERNGKPDKVYQCGTTDILYYKYGLKL